MRIGDQSFESTDGVDRQVGGRPDAAAIRRELEVARLKHAAEVADLRRQILEARKLAGLGELRVRVA